MYDTRSGREVACFPGTSLPSFSADGKTFALLDGDGHVKLWDLPLQSAFLYWALIATTTAVTFFFASSAGPPVVGCSQNQRRLLNPATKQHTA